MAKSPITPAAPSAGATSKKDSGSARSLGDALDQPQLHSLLQRASQLAAIQRELRAYLNTPWAGSLRVANVRGTALTVFTDNGAALTQLRHRHADLIAALNRRLGLQLSKLDLKVRPAHTLGATRSRSRP